MCVCANTLQVIVLKMGSFLRISSTIPFLCLKFLFPNSQFKRNCRDCKEVFIEKTIKARSFTPLNSLTTRWHIPFCYSQSALHYRELYDITVQVHHMCLQLQWFRCLTIIVLNETLKFGLLILIQRDSNSAQNNRLTWESKGLNNLYE